MPRKLPSLELKRLLTRRARMELHGETYSLVYWENKGKKPDYARALFDIDDLSSIDARLPGLVRHLFDVATYEDGGNFKEVSCHIVCNTLHYWKNPVVLKDVTGRSLHVFRMRHTRNHDSDLWHCKETPTLQFKMVYYTLSGDDDVEPGKYATSCYMKTIEVAGEELERAYPGWRNTLRSYQAVHGNDMKPQEMIDRVFSPFPSRRAMPETGATMPDILTL